MCGRFTIISDPVAYQMEFDIQIDGQVLNDWKARYNVVPSQAIPVVAQSETLVLKFMRWGLIPPWGKADNKKFQLINVRAESILEKPYFRNLLQKQQRCFILADGFYEWQAPGPGAKTKIPHYFRLKERKPFVFASLWDSGEIREGTQENTCAIITCNPNPLVAPIHQRMPVILNAQTGQEWLGLTDLSHLLALLKPYPAEEMTSHEVSRLVNSPAADSPDCILPATS